MEDSAKMVHFAMTEVTEEHHAVLTVQELKLIFNSIDMADYRSVGRPRILNWVQLLDYFVALKKERLAIQEISAVKLTSFFASRTMDSYPPQHVYGYTLDVYETMAMYESGVGEPTKLYESVACRTKSLETTKNDKRVRDRVLAVKTGYATAKAAKQAKIVAATKECRAYTLEAHLKATGYTV